MERDPVTPLAWPKSANVLAANMDSDLMGFFSDLNDKISANLAAHGHYLTDPHAQDREKLDETIELLMPFVRSDAREAVKSQIFKLIKASKNDGIELEDE